MFLASGFAKTKRGLELGYDGNGCAEWIIGRDCCASQDTGIR